MNGCEHLCSTYDIHLELECFLFGERERMNVAGCVRFLFGERKEAAVTDLRPFLRVNLIMQCLNICDKRIYIRFRGSPRSAEADRTVFCIHAALV